jgi:Tol biopolymer transport system component
MKPVPRLAVAILSVVVQLSPDGAVGARNAAQPLIKRKPDWTVDDVLSCELAYEFSISPDCRWVAWVKTVPDKDKNQWVGNVFLSSLTESNEIQLTRSAEGCGAPKWSPDGRLIAFISSRPLPKANADDKEQARIWLINPFGGEPWVLTGGERPISGFDWADTNSITLISSVPWGHSSSGPTTTAVLTTGCPGWNRASAGSMNWRLRISRKESMTW